MESLTAVSVMRRPRARVGDTRSASAPKSSRARLADRKHRDNIWDGASVVSRKWPARKKIRRGHPAGTTLLTTLRELIAACARVQKSAILFNALHDEVSGASHPGCPAVETARNSRDVHP